MYQQINLYLPEFKVKKDRLTPLLMGRVLGAVTIVLPMISAYYAMTIYQLNSELASLEEILVEETRQTDALDIVLARRSQNTELSNRLEQAEKRLDSSRQIRNFLRDTKLGNVTGFSEYFKDLSRAAFAGLSLNEFSFADGGEQAVLAGQVRDSSMVPRYVDNIAAGLSGLRTKQFSPSITRSAIEDQYFSFVLSTTNE